MVTISAAAPVLSQEMPPTLVETDIVREMEFHDQITLVGRTRAWAESRIVAAVSGQVVRVDAPEGHWLKRGEVLVTIDSDRIQYALEAKRAEAAQAEAQADLAEKDLARAKDLLQQSLISDNEMDTAVAEAEVALQTVVAVRDKVIDAYREIMRMPM